MLVISSRIPWTCVCEELDPNGRYIILHGKLGPRTLAIVGVYCPNAGQSEFGDILGNKLSNIDKHGLIILGDFNAVLNKEQDHSKITQTPEAPLLLRVLIKDWDLVDVW